MAIVGGGGGAVRSYKGRDDDLYIMSLMIPYQMHAYDLWPQPSIQIKVSYLITIG